MGVPYLGAIPLDPEMVKAGDEERAFILRHTESPTRKAVDAVIENLIKNRLKPKKPTTSHTHSSGRINLPLQILYSVILSMIYIKKMHGS